MSTNHAKIHAFIGLVLLFVISSCKKEIKSETAPVPQAVSIKKRITEQAFPGMQGEILETRWRAQAIHVQKKGDKYVWLGDIAFDQRTFDSLQAAAKGPQNQRTFTSDATHNWTFGSVCYSIASGFTANEQTMINNAIQHWAANSSISFVQRNGQSNYISIQPGRLGSGRYSDYIGMKGGKQIINLESGAFDAGTVIHEIGHCIGFYHEQSRTDRGNSIIVNLNNVSPNTNDNRYQFETYAQRGEPGGQIGAFDFNSIMLYGSFDFSDGVHPVMTRLDGSVFNGQRVGLSAGDVETSNFLYGPPYAKVFMVATSSYYNPYGEDFDVSGDVVISFYSDAACTTLTNLPVDKQATITNIVREKSNGSYYNYDVPTTYNLTAGSSSYTIGSYHSFDDSYLGISNNYRYDSYYLENGYRR